MTEKKQGFASLDPSRHREIAAMGGRTAHARGVAHTYNTEEARSSGSKGGIAVSRDRKHMAEIGRRGGRSRAAKEAQRKREHEQSARASEELSNRQQEARATFGSVN